MAVGAAQGRRDLFKLARERVAEASRRAVLYGRYSSAMQSDGWSLEAQFTELRRFCERSGWEIVYEDSDAETSGKAGTARPGFERCMAAVREGRGNVFVAHKIDRFGRSMVEILSNAHALEECGAGLVCTQQGIDTTSPISGKVVLAVLAALAEVYLDNLSEETAKGKRARAAHGLPNGDLPYGYALPEEGAGGSGQANRVVAVVVPERASAVRRAFELYLSGRVSDAGVARALNAEGRRMVSKRHPGGYPFTKDTITAMLQNPFYVGLVSHVGGELRRRHGTGQLVAGLHEALIEREVFEQAQRVRAGRRRRGHANAPERHAGVYVAAGLARCTACGQALRVNASYAGRVVRYRDASQERGVPCGARRRSLPAALIDATLAAFVAQVELPVEWRALVMTGVREVDDSARRVERRVQLERDLARAQRLVLDGYVTEEQFRAKRAEIVSELGELAPAAESVDLERAAALLRDLRALWEKVGEEGRAALARDLFAAVWCDLDAGVVVEVELHAELQPLRAVVADTITVACDGVVQRNRRASGQRHDTFTVRVV